MTEVPGELAGTYSHHLAKAAAVQSLIAEKTTKNVNANKQIQSQARNPAVSKKSIQKAVRIPTKQENKSTLDQSYQGAQAFLYTGELFLFKHEDYKGFVPIELFSSPMPPTVHVFNTGAGPNLIRCIVPDPVHTKIVVNTALQRSVGHTTLFRKCRELVHFTSMCENHLLA